MKSHHDHRRSDNEDKRQSKHIGMKRERPTSPDERTKLEAERKARMARLRAENEEERAIEQEESVQEVKGPKNSIIEVNPDELEGMDEEEQMQALLGFGGGFGSTKNTKVEDNHASSARGAAAKRKARKYRQYMNRKNGFNRPLDKMD